MKIIHKIDEFLFTLFPELIGGSNDLINNELEKYYTYGPYKPKVGINEDWVTIEIDIPTILAQDADYQRTVALCEQGNYAAAKPILKNLIAQNPTISEYHRILGQIHSDEGNQEEAINCLIDALRWDSKNGWALLMMGNIFAKFKSDVDTAMKYYDQALASNKADHITLANVAYILLQDNKIEQAKKYAYEAQKLKADYPNSSFILSLIAKQENDYHSAFYSIIQVLKHAKAGDELHQNAVKQAFEIVKQLTEVSSGKEIFFAYRSQLEKLGGIEINIFKDDEIKTAAKIEFAERYHREKHLVKYKSSHPAISHLVMHELVHLDFAIQARKEKRNHVFLSTPKNKENFLETIPETTLKLRKMGVEESMQEKFIDGIFDGLNLQCYNTPIDVFIEDFLYQNYPELRPYQFLSLYNLLQEGVEAVTDARVLEIAPENVVSKTKIYSLVNALQFRELFGLNILAQFNASAAELQQAETFYAEFSNIKEKRQPGQEFDVVKNWAKALKMDAFFELQNELSFDNKDKLDDFLTNLLADPFGLEAEDASETAEMEKFQEQNSDSGTDMAIVLFMVDALNHFKNKSPEEIKKTALEIAMLGTTGIDPNKKEYIISSIAGKRFSGNQVLAYYYVSWDLAIPDQVAHLGLSFESEYRLAKTLQ
jgi:tetratricopeptide (TPR) repeat protein